LAASSKKKPVQAPRLSAVRRKLETLDKTTANACKLGSLPKCEVNTERLDRPTGLLRGGAATGNCDEQNCDEDEAVHYQRGGFVVS
jgi:hypothetical protein